MFNQQNDPDEGEESSLYDDVARMADRMGLQGKDRNDYIADHMTQAGYEPVMSRESWAKPVPVEQQQQEGGGRKSWFSGRGQQQAGAPRNPAQQGADGDRF